MTITRMRFENTKTGEVYVVHEGETLVLPRGTYVMLDPTLPDNCVVCGEGVVPHLPKLIENYKLKERGLA